MLKLLFNVIAAGIGLWLADMYVPGVEIAVLPDSSFFGIILTEQWYILLLLGIILGLLNFFVKPILDIITLPLRIITLGLFGFLINMGLIFAVDAMFEEFSAPFLYPLLWTSLIIWGINLVLSTFTHKSE